MLIQSPHPSGRLDFPEGLHINRSYQLCEFHFTQREVELFRFELEYPGYIQLPDGSTISLEYVDTIKEIDGLDKCILNPSEIEFPIIVRTRINGDRIHPKGMSGTKKIKDIFIDSKIPINYRTTWPIVTNGSGTILWIPQLKVSNHESRHEALDSYLLLTYKKH
jgi:tRNA(Ile)-lysidine synthase